MRDVMRQRTVGPDFAETPDKLYKVMTISQSGEIREREPGKGINPPAWRGTYLEATRGDWFAAYTGDVVFSRIDLWKGCIAVVPPEFNGALVSKEFPIYEVTDPRLSADFLQTLLRSRYYQRAFRAITTGHSNRRRTQVGDFLDLEIAFPENKAEQAKLIAHLQEARALQERGKRKLEQGQDRFDDQIDGRGTEKLSDVRDEGDEPAGSVL